MHALQGAPCSSSDASPAAAASAAATRHRAASQPRRCVPPTQRFIERMVDVRERPWLHRAGTPEKREQPELAGALQGPPETCDAFKNTRGGVQFSAQAERNPVTWRWSPPPSAGQCAWPHLAPLDGLFVRDKHCNYTPQQDGSLLPSVPKPLTPQLALLGGDVPHRRRHRAAPQQLLRQPVPASTHAATMHGVNCIPMGAGSSDSAAKACTAGPLPTAHAPLPHLTLIFLAPRPRCRPPSACWPCSPAAACCSASCSWRATSSSDSAPPAHRAQGRQAGSVSEPGRAPSGPTRGACIEGVHAAAFTARNACLPITASLYARSSARRVRLAARPLPSLPAAVLGPAAVPACLLGHGCSACGGAGAPLL